MTEPLNDPRDISRAHARALKQMVEDAVDYEVFVGRPNRLDSELTYPHLIVWPSPANRQQVNLTASSASPESLIQITAIGRDPDEAMTALDRAAAALQGRKPPLNIAGWRPGRVKEQPVNQPASKNEELSTPDGQPTYRAWSLFRIRSEPAPLDQ